MTHGGEVPPAGVVEYLLETAAKLRTLAAGRLADGDTLAGAELHQLAARLELQAERLLEGEK